MQQLSMDELAVKSTAIVQGTVMDSYFAVSGPTVYTHYHVSVSATLKGGHSSVVDVALPGGTADGIRQNYPGVPQLVTGQKYLLYLWTSPTGITMPTGFSQGILTVSGDSASGMVSRSVIGEMMLDSSGHPVRDHAISMRLSDLRRQVSSALAASRTSATPNAGRPR